MWMLWPAQREKGDDVSVLDGQRRGHSEASKELVSLPRDWTLRKDGDEFEGQVTDLDTLPRPTDDPTNITLLKAQKAHFQLRLDLALGIPLPMLSLPRTQNPKDLGTLAKWDEMAIRIHVGNELVKVLLAVGHDLPLAVPLHAVIVLCYFPAGVSAITRAVVCGDIGGAEGVQRGREGEKWPRAGWRSQACKRFWYEG